MHTAKRWEALVLAGLFLGGWIETATAQSTAPQSAPPVITGPSTASGQVGKPFALTFTATNSPNQYAIRSGTVPPGLRVDLMIGTITGTPTQAGSFGLVVAAANSGANGSQWSANFSVTFSVAPDPAAPPPTSPPPPQITGPGSALGEVGKPFSLSFTATNGPTHYAISSGTVPPGLNMDLMAGTITGTPTQPGSFTLTIRAANSGPSGSQWTANFILTLTITGTPPPPPPPRPLISWGSVNSNPVIGGVAEPGARVTLYIDGRVLGTTTADTTRGGWTLDTAGSPPLAVGRYSLTAIAVNTTGVTSPVSNTFTLDIAGTKPSLADQTINGQVGVPLSGAAVSARGDPAPSNYMADTLPAGISLDRISGRFSGTPTEAGTKTASVTAENRVGMGSARITFNIAPAAPAAPSTATTTPIAATPTTSSTAAVPTPPASTTATPTSPGPTTAGSTTTSPSTPPSPAPTGSTPTTEPTSPPVGSTTPAPTPVSTNPTTPPPSAPPPVNTTPPTTPVTPPTTTSPTTAPIPPATITAAPAPTAPTATTPPVTTTPTPSTAITPPPPTTPAPTTAPVATTPFPSGTAPSVTTTTPPATTVVPTTTVKAPQSIDVNVPAAKQPDDAPFPVAASSSAGLPVTLEVVSGPATLHDNVLALTGETGVVSVRAVQSGTAEIEPAEVTRSFMVAPADATRLANLSARMDVSDADPARAFITGFVVAGDAPRRVLLRATGPALAAFGVERVLSNPHLRVMDEAGRVVAENDDWRDAETRAVGAAVGAFPLQPGTADAAVLLLLPPGSYSMQVMTNGGSGVALAEVFDATDRNTGGGGVVNMSTRGFVGHDQAQLTSGFVISGSAQKRVLVRAAGPALARFNITGWLADPSLTVYSGATVLAQNDDWAALQSTGAANPRVSAADVAAAEKAVGAFAFESASRDSAVVLDLAPGAYTATVGSAAGETGVALLEVYEVAPPRDAPARPD